MAITLEELQVIVTANSKELTNEMKAVQSKLKNLEKDAAAATGSISTGFIEAASKAAAVTAVIGGVVFAVKKLVDQSKEYIGLQAIQTEAETKLETVMKQRMSATDGMVQAVKDLAAAQQEIGVIGDEIQMAGAQQIATFLKTRSALEELIPAMNNLAAQQMGYNVTAEGTKNIGNMLGKVMQGQTSALTRVGITFSEAEEKALKYGSEAERAAALAKIIKNNVGDMNKALADTPNGAIVQLSNNFGDLKETIGGILLPIFASLAKQINNLVVLLNNALTKVKEFVEVAFGKLFSDTNKAAVSAAAEIRGIGESAEDSADDTVKAVKKIKGALAGIDEINVLKLNDEESETGGVDDGEIASIIDESAVSEADTIFDKISDRLSDFISRIKEELARLKGIFDEGFKIGLGNGGIDLGDISSILDSFKNGIKGIFGDGEVFNASREFFDKMAYGLGEMAGAFTSIGNTIAINLLGGMGKYLEQNSGYIKDRLVGIYGSWGDIFAQMGDFSAAAADVFTVFRGETAQQITADIIGIYSNAFLGTIDLIGRLTSDVLKLMTQPFIDNKDIIKTTLGNMLEPIQKMTGTTSKWVTDTFAEIFRAYDEYISPAFENFSNGFSKIVKGAVETYNNYVVPLLERWSEQYEESYEEHIKPVTEKIMTVLGKLGLVLSELFNDYVAPVLGAINKALMASGAVVCELLGDLIFLIGNALWDLTGIVMDALDWLLDGKLGIWIAEQCDLIGGYWSNAWDEMANTVKAAWAFVELAVKSGVNGLIDLLNGFKIEIPVALRTVLKDTGIDLPDKIGFNIPKLAKGGIIDNPTLAMIGEAGKEAVVPLENNAGGLDLLADLLSSRIEGEQPINIELTLNVGGERIAANVVKQINTMSRAAGRTVIDIV